MNGYVVIFLMGVVIVVGAYYLVPKVRTWVDTHIFHKGANPPPPPPPPTIYPPPMPPLIKTPVPPGPGNATYGE